MKLINYKDKYIKYKNKYLEIKNINQKGGMDCNNDRVFKNILGTCWMVAILTMLCFSNVTKDDIERVLNFINKDNIDCFIKELIELRRHELESFFPSAYLKIANREELLFNLLKAFITRYSAKLGNPLTEKQKDVDDISNKDRCERVMSLNLKNLLPYYSKRDDYSGNLIEQFYIANILGIFFLQNKIYFQNHTRKNYKNIKFDPIQDIGIMFFLDDHVCCGFFCGNAYKFYNYEKIYDYDWKKLLLELQPNEDLFVDSNSIVKLDRTKYFDDIDDYQNYERIQFITVVSKKKLEENLNTEIQMFFSGNYEINDFFLLFLIYKKILNTNIKKALEYIKKSSEYGYNVAQYIIGVLFTTTDLSKQYLKLAFDNGSVGAALKLGNICVKENNFENAIKYFKIAVINTSMQQEVATSLFDIYYLKYKNYRLAMHYKSMYSKEEVLKELEKLKDFTELKKLADEGFVDLQFNVGKIFLTEKKIPEAIDYFTKATKSKDNNILEKAALELGEIYLMQKNIVEAINYYLLAFYSKQNNISASASLKLGEIYLSTEDISIAIHYLKTATEKGTDDISSEAALKLSEIYLNQSKNSEAIKYLKIAVEKGTDDISAKSALKLSEIYLNEKNIPEAIIYLKIATQKGTDDISSKAALKLSEIYLNEQNIPEAIIYLKIATQKGTDDISAKSALKLGEIYEKEHSYENAIKYLEIAIKYPSTKVTAASILFTIYYLIYKNYRLAMHYKPMVAPLNDKQLKKIEDFTKLDFTKLEDFKKLKEVADNGFIDLQYEVAEKYQNEENIPDAIRYFKLAADAGKSNISTNSALKLAEIYKKEGKNSDAIIYLQKAIENPSLLSKALPMLQKLTKNY